MLSVNTSLTLSNLPAGYGLLLASVESSQRRTLTAVLRYLMLSLFPSLHGRGAQYSLRILGAAPVSEPSSSSLSLSSRFLERRLAEAVTLSFTQDFVSEHFVPASSGNGGQGHQGGGNGGVGGAALAISTFSGALTSAYASGALTTKMAAAAAAVGDANMTFASFASSPLMSFAITVLQSAPSARPSVAPTANRRKKRDSVSAAVAGAAQYWYVILIACALVVCTGGLWIMRRRALVAVSPKARTASKRLKRNLSASWYDTVLDRFAGGSFPDSSPENSSRSGNRPSLYRRSPQFKGPGAVLPGASDSDIDLEASLSLFRDRVKHPERYNTTLKAKCPASPKDYQRPEEHPSFLSIRSTGSNVSELTIDTQFVDRQVVATDGSGSPKHYAKRSKQQPLRRSSFQMFMDSPSRISPAPAPAHGSPQRPLSSGRLIGGVGLGLGFGLRPSSVNSDASTPLRAHDRSVPRIDDEKEGKRSGVVDYIPSPEPSPSPHRFLGPGRQGHRDYAEEGEEDKLEDEGESEANQSAVWNVPAQGDSGNADQASEYDAGTTRTNSTASTSSSSDEEDDAQVNNDFVYAGVSPAGPMPLSVSGLVTTTPPHPLQPISSDSPAALAQKRHSHSRRNVLDPTTLHIVNDTEAREVILGEPTRAAQLPRRRYVFEAVHGGGEGEAPAIYHAHPTTLEAPEPSSPLSGETERTWDKKVREAKDLL